MSTADFAAFCRDYNLGEVATEQNINSNEWLLCSHFISEFQAMADDFISEIPPTESRITVDVGFSTNLDVNACAAKYKTNHYIILINRGVTGKLFWLFDEIFTNSPRFTSTFEIQESLGNITFPERISTFAFFAAMRFLFFHEFGHIALGHTDLIRHPELLARSGFVRPWRRPKRTNLLVEAADILPKSTPVSAGLLQSMEILADRFATWQVLMRREALFGDTPTVSIFNDQQMVRIIGIAIFIMFICFYEMINRKDDLTAASHPHPDTRLVDFVFKVTEILEDDTSDDDIPRFCHKLARISATYIFLQ